MQIEIIKDFVRPEYQNPVMDLWEFFNDNTQYRLLKYVPIRDGIRAFYVVVS